MRPVQEEMAANTQDIRTLIRLVWCDVGSKLLRSIICASTVTCSATAWQLPQEGFKFFYDADGEGVQLTSNQWYWRRGLVPHVSLLAALLQLGIWFGSKAVALHLLVGPLFRLLDAEREHLLSRTEVSRKKQWRKAQTWRDIWFKLI